MLAALYVVLCLIWGSTWLAIKIGLTGVPPFLGAGLRFLLSTLLIGLVLAARRKRLELTRDDNSQVHHTAYFRDSRTRDFIAQSLGF